MACGRLSAGRDVGERIPELLAARLIEETPHGYRFQHDLTRQQIYKAIETERLQRLHPRDRERTSWRARGTRC